MLVSQHTGVILRFPLAFGEKRRRFLGGQHAFIASISPNSGTFCPIHPSGRAPFFGNQTSYNTASPADRNLFARLNPAK
jgi:hypothetical protein